MKIYKKPSIVSEIDKGAAFPSMVMEPPLILAGAAARALMRDNFPIDSNRTQILNARHKK